mmetsp:Transcript_79800/g.211780  ORF Transcript_79800/g.211780 Transcript_79800/m.211780 type:complete len:208 (-) Transcript_79800:388-1011(-)
MISGSRLYTTLVLRLESSWKRMRATLDVASCEHAVSHSARTSNTARGFIMSLSTRCVSTRSAVSRNSVAEAPSGPACVGPESVPYRRPVHGSTTLGCLKRRSPTATNKDCRRVKSSKSVPDRLALATKSCATSCASVAALNGASLPLGNRIEKRICKFSSQKRLDTVMNLQRLMAPTRRRMGSLRNSGFSKHEKISGLTLSSRLRAP